MSLPLDYITSGVCIPFVNFIDPDTITLKTTLNTSTSTFANTLSDSGDITGAIDAMLTGGAAELNKNMAILGKLIGEALKSINDIYSGNIIDTVLNEAEILFASIMSSISSVMAGVTALIESLQNMLLNAVQGIKTILCYPAIVFLDSVPIELVAGSIAAVAVKNLSSITSSVESNIPGDIGSVQTILTDTILKNSGIQGAFDTAVSLIGSVNSNIISINSMASSICGSTNFKLIDSLKVTKDVILKLPVP